MKIKKGNLNYDQSGRAYPDEPQINENWDCIWEFEGKHYILVGDDEHKEWEEVNIYNQIIDESYKNYYNQVIKLCHNDHGVGITRPHTQEEFINRIKTEKKFSEMWGLNIEERELTYKERWFLNYNETFEDWEDRNWKNGDLIIPRCSLEDEWTEQGISTKLITITYNNETIEVYE
jgi:adenylate kinase family enzyme